MSTDRTPQTFIVGTDGSKNAHRAIQWAIENAHVGDTVAIVHSWQVIVYGAEVPAGFVIDEKGPKALLADEVNKFSVLAKDHGVHLDGRLMQGDARSALLTQTGDILVLGARGHGPLVSAVLGSVADYVVHHSHRPVVIVPDPDTKK